MAKVDNEGEVGFGRGTLGLQFFWSSASYYFPWDAID